MAEPSATPMRNPYPGLRPFRSNEKHLFFGREQQVDRMVEKLAAHHFLAVVGGSGSGKSSLVNCGLRPALHRGNMASGGAAWRMAQMRPGSDPIGSLARALAETGVLLDEPLTGALSGEALVELTLRLGSLGLIDMVEQADLPSGTRVLVVVDQFEELFRFRSLASGARTDGISAAEDAVAFVCLLLEAAAQTKVPIYVVLTMRSDFLGDCARFHGLPEAINQGQYLVPRLTRSEIRAALTGPAAVAGATLSPVLITRLLNDVGDSPDQLSILQHALNRTWARWEGTGGQGPLELAHYEAIGTMAHALDRHAERAYKDLGTPQQQQVCERLFKALTDKATDPRGVRRPTKLATLCALAGATSAEVSGVIEVFRKPSRSFLMPPGPEALAPETVIDIAHESLMRVWQRLNTWADEENQSAQMYRRLADTAALHAERRARLWGDPELQLALDWRGLNQPNETWASRYDYDAGFAAAMDFLDRSEQESQLEERQAQQQRQLKLRHARIIAGVAAAFCLLLIAVAVAAVINTRRADELQANALWQAGVGARDQDLGVSAAQKFLGAAQASDGLLSLFNRTQRANFELAAQFAAAELIRAFPHDSDVVGVAVKGDDTRILSWSEDGALNLWDVDPKHFEWLYAWNHEGRVNGAVFNLSGAVSRVLSWTDDGAVLLFDEKTGVEIQRWKHDKGVVGARFNADGSRVLSWGRDGAVKLWDANAASPPGGEPSQPLRAWKHDQPVNGAIFTKDHARILSWGNDGAVKLWDPNSEDAKPLMSWKSRDSVRGDETGVRGAEVTPDGRRVLAWGRLGILTLWDMGKTEPQGVWAHYGVGEVGKPIDCNVYPTDDGSRVFCTDLDGQWKLWDLKHSGGVPLFAGKIEAASNAAAAANEVRVMQEVRTHDASRVLRWGAGEPLRLWKLKKAEALRTFKAADKSLDCAMFTHDGLRAITFSVDGTVRMRDLSTGDSLGVWRHVNTQVSCAADPEDGSRVVTWSGNGELKFWDANAAKSPDDTQAGPLHEWKHAAAVIGALFSRDGSRVVAWSNDGAVSLWDVTQDGPVKQWKRDSQGVLNGAMFTPDESRLLAWYNDGAVKLWNAKPGPTEPLREWKLKDGVTSALFTQDGQQALLSTKRGALEWLNLGKNETESIGKLNEIRIRGAMFTPDESDVLAWSNDGMLRLYGVSRKGLLREWKHGAQAQVSGAMLMPKESRVLSWGTDGTLKLWDTAHAEALQVWRHDRAVRGAQLMPGRAGSSRILSWSEDGVLKLWDTGLKPPPALKHRQRELEVRSASCVDPEGKSHRLRYAGWLELAKSQRSGSTLARPKKCEQGGDP